MDQTAAALWGSPTFPRVLAILLEQPDREFPFSELVDGTGADRESVHRALLRGIAASLVTRRKIGNQYLYRADLGSPFFSEMRLLTAKTYGIQHLMVDLLSGIGPPAVDLAFTYGSFAAGAAGALSDIDVMVIGTISRGELAQRLSTIQDRTGRTVNGLAYPRKDVEFRLRTGDAFFLEVWANPKVMLVGSEEELPTVTEGAVSWS